MARHEAKFIQRIVEEISLELCSICFNTDEKLVGMETRIKNLVPSLGIGCDDVRMIGMKGMGGGGKTTLARALFDKISLQFEGKSFVENVQENASSFGLKSLQKQFLSDVLNDKDINISSIYDGKHTMKRRLHDKKSLVVLDDVDHIDQLEVLADELNWFKPGSVIIITTRDEQVLVAHQVKFIHDVNLLSDKEAICLFSRFAFGRDIPIQGYEELSRKVVRYAAGLPLTIRVLGSFLCGKDELEWIDALERLKSILETETLKKLELSYISLEEDYKELVHVDLSGCLRFRYFKFQIKSCTSCSVDESLEVGPLAELHLCVESIERCPLHPNNNMPTFWFDCVYKEDRPSLTRNLEILLSVGMCACTNLETFSRSICGLQRLRKLELKGSFLEVIKDLDELECTEELVVLSTHIKHLPDSIYMFKHLKSLELTYCLLLETLLEDLGQLECLENLDSSHTKIKHLPDSICMWKRLKNIKLISCSLFEKLPKDLGQLECLENLDLSHTTIKHLPNRICMLKCLKSLKLYDCLLFEKLPEDIGQLECLKNLNLMGYGHLQDIPNCICEMKCLKYFNLYNCIRVEKVPEELGRLECLKELDVKGTSISHLSQSILLLKDLHISGLGQLLESCGFTPIAGVSSTVLHGCF